MNAVIYARYSSDNQREESIEGQLRECREYAERNGMTVVETYIDCALSAKTADRPEFQHMIKDSAKELFKINQFVNAVYVFDDKLVLTYNYQHGTEAVSLDEIESASSSDFNGLLHQPWMDRSDAILFIVALAFRWMSFSHVQEYKERHVSACDDYIDMYRYS